MAWEWVAPAGTSVIGVTSIVATTFASRSATRREERSALRQRAYAIEDALRAERKTAFVRLLDLVNDLHDAVGRACDRSVPTDDRHAALSEVLRITRAVLRVEFEIDIVAGRGVSAATHRIANEAVAVQGKAMEDPPTLQYVAGEAIAEFVVAASVELTLTPPSSRLAPAPPA